MITSPGFTVHYCFHIIFVLHINKIIATTGSLQTNYCSLVGWFKPVPGRVYPGPPIIPLTMLHRQGLKPRTWLWLVIIKYPPWWTNLKHGWPSWSIIFPMIYHYYWPFWCTHVRWILCLPICAPWNPKPTLWLAQNGRWCDPLSTFFLSDDGPWTDSSCRSLVVDLANAHHESFVFLIPIPKRLWVMVNHHEKPWTTMDYHEPSWFPIIQPFNHDSPWLTTIIDHEGS